MSTAPRTLDAAVFFPAGRRPSQPLQGHGALVHGARAVGKTSLAFEAAVNTVLSGGSVVVLCKEAALYAKLPQPFTPLRSLSAAALGRLDFIYVDGWTAALREMMTFRTTRAVPTMALIDEDGFDVAPAPADRREGRAGQRPELLQATAAAACLSYLSNLHDWMTRQSRPFFYVVATNELPESASQLSLPYTAFPLVDVWVGASGVVEITPVAAERAVVVVAPAYIAWRDGLCLRD